MHGMTLPCYITMDSHSMVVLTYTDNTVYSFMYHKKTFEYIKINFVTDKLAATLGFSTFAIGTSWLLNYSTVA